MMKYDIVRRPIITEKTTAQKELHNQITFEVSQSVNSIEVKKAIEKIFDVRVDKVRVLNVKGKVKRRGNILGKRRNFKKALVTLSDGERIEFFEGV